MVYLQPKATTSHSCDVTVNRCSVTSRYCTCDWEKAFERNYTDASKERNHAERVRVESWRDVQVSDKRAQNRQCSNTKKLGLSPSPLSHPVELVRFLLTDIGRENV